MSWLKEQSRFSNENSNSNNNNSGGDILVFSLLAKYRNKIININLKNNYFF